MDFVSHLTSNNIKPSLQRIKIFEYLYENTNHPTVDKIYTDLASDIPTLSKTTVYNTLKLFIDNGITSTFTIDGNESRYDAIMEEHAHFKCNACNNVYDVEIEALKLKFSKLNDFQIDNTSIYLKGICNKCLTNKN